jgi:tripartite-type tricarboxylate transporter receptor subunit TctC
VKNTKNLIIFGFTLFLCLGYPIPGFSQDFPTRPIKMLVFYPPGGSTDLLARAFQVPLEKEIGTKIIVENIPGGSGKVGTLELLKAKPDGYTITLHADMSWVYYYHNKIYDSKFWEKLTPLGNVNREGYGFFEVNAESPYIKWEDFMKRAKENPGKLLVTGAISMQFILNEVLKASGIKVKFVPVRGSADITIQILGGHADLGLHGQAQDGIPMMRAGKSRGLAVNTEKRMKALPDVPTFKELGIWPGPPALKTVAIWGPPNLPPKIASTIAKAVERATQNPDFVKTMTDNFAFNIEYIPPDKEKESLMNFDKVYGPGLAEE